MGSARLTKHGGGGTVLQGWSPFPFWPRVGRTNNATPAKRESMLDFMMIEKGGLDENDSCSSKFDYCWKKLMSRWGIEKEDGKKERWRDYIFFLSAKLLTATVCWCRTTKVTMEFRRYTGTKPAYFSVLLASLVPSYIHGLLYILRYHPIYPGYLTLVLIQSHLLYKRKHQDSPVLGYLAGIAEANLMLLKTRYIDWTCKFMLIQIVLPDHWMGSVPWELARPGAGGPRSYCAYCNMPGSSW